MHPPRYLFLILFLIFVFPGGGIPGKETQLHAFDGENKALNLGGSIRTIGAWIDNYDYEPFFGDHARDSYSQTLLRIIGSGNPTEELSCEVHIVDSLTYYSGTGGAGGVVDLEAADTRYRTLDLSWEQIDEKYVQAILWPDRLQVKYVLAGADITLGRQAITFGKAHFWNPLDVYLPFDPNQFDRDYKAGVDGLRMDLYLGNFSGLTLVGVAGREVTGSGTYAGGKQTVSASWYGSSVLARGYTNIQGWDLVLQGGKIYGGYQLGGGVVGDVSLFQVRGEGVYFWAENSPDLPPPYEGTLYENHFSGVAGVSHRFPNSLTLEMEYFFNGGSSSDLTTSWVRQKQGALLHMGEHLLGFLASYEFQPIVTGQLTVLRSLTDSSMQFQPILTVSLSDNAECLLGASLNAGDRPQGTTLADTEIKSEFGASTNLYFIEVKYYF